MERKGRRTSKSANGTSNAVPDKGEETGKVIPLIPIDFQKAGGFSKAKKVVEFEPDFTVRPKFMESSTFIPGVHQEPYKTIAFMKWERRARARVKKAVQDILDDEFPVDMKYFRSFSDIIEAARQDVADFAMKLLKRPL